MVPGITCTRFQKQSCQKFPCSILQTNANSLNQQGDTNAARLKFDIPIKAERSRLTSISLYRERAGGVNVSRLKFDIPVKIERSRLTSILL